MEVFFDRELNRDYLVLQEKEEMLDYECRMVTDNQPKHFLKAFFRRDEEAFLYYDVTSLHSLMDFFCHGTVTKEEFVSFLSALLEAFREADEYMLQYHRIFLTPERIFVDDSGHYFFCFSFPKENETENDLCRLFQFILEHISSKDFLTIGFCYSLLENSRQQIPKALMEEICFTKSTEKKERPKELLPALSEPKPVKKISTHKENIFKRCLGLFDFRKKDTALLLSLDENPFLEDDQMLPSETEKEKENIDADE